MRLLLGPRGVSFSSHLSPNTRPRSQSSGRVAMDQGIPRLGAAVEPQLSAKPVAKSWRSNRALCGRLRMSLIMSRQASASTLDANASLRVNPFRSRRATAGRAMHRFCRRWREPPCGRWPLRAPLRILATRDAHGLAMAVHPQVGAARLESGA
jgi:hypothetical protein